jgi:SNF2 family DNA or RNA helicase
MVYKPYPYQDYATRHIVDNSPGAGAFLDMGLGKTVSTLTAVDELIYDRLEISRVLVIAPKRVAEEVWTTERDKWDHLQHLKISKVLGTEKQRKEALKKVADIYVINRENTAWLISYLKGSFPFDMLVIDESSSFKSHKSGRFKALRAVRPKIKRVVILTGTPAPNGLMDLWAQLYLLDRGERLYPTITEYRTRLFTINEFKPFADYELLKEPDELIGEDYHEKKIYERISDICISMKAEDYLQLPERITRIAPVRLSPEDRTRYNEFERDAVLALINEEGEISAVNAAALTNKLLQFANGAVYDSDKNYHVVHGEKLEALQEIIDTASGHPVLIFYSYRHDLERMQEKIKGLTVLKGSAEIQGWNRGEIPVMAAHPASAGHGLNLQAGGNIIVWFGLTWSLELYQQANARLHRQGQTKPVIIHHLITAGTMDEKVMQVLESKASGQEALLQAVKALINKYKV